MDFETLNCEMLPSRVEMAAPSVVKFLAGKSYCKNGAKFVIIRLKGVAMKTSNGQKLPVILAIDDTPMDLRIVQVFLDKKYDILTAKNGPYGLELVKKQEIGLILLDLNMPTMSGFAFLAELHKIPAKMDIPVICITGLDSTPELITQVIHAGAQDFISKPFDKEILESKVRKALKIDGYTDP
ncbi:hypothetical protein FACS1894190_15550 [Spirochaetia bacterium]|nr:hypothetical protein FACS1894190_15550 [Spirochaetia bacterium]